MVSDHHSSNISELSVIYEISSSIKRNLKINHLLEVVYDILNAYMGIDDVCLWLKDPNEGLFKQVFSKKNVFEPAFINTINATGSLEQSLMSEKLMFVTPESRLLSIDCFDQNNLKIIPDEFSLLLPVVEKGSIEGILGIFSSSQPRKEITTESLIMLSVLGIQVSAAVIYDKLNKKIMTEIEMSSATKEIAKIIETQYELKYVVPIMGEILDKYLPNALVYMFIRNSENDLELFWPNSYSTQVVDPLLKELQETSAIVLTPDKQAIAIPVFVKNHVFGAIVADAKVTEITEKEMDLLKSFSEQCSITVNRAASYAETVKHATVDALTGLENRRQLDKRLYQEASLVLRTHRPLALLMIDIDHFKQVNDTHGHSVGDYALKEIAKLIKQTVRDYDVAGRYGGEEFVIILPDTTQEGAVKLADRLRKTVERSVLNISKFTSSKSETINLTLSIGVAVFDSDCKNPADVYEEADIALYKAKQEGRNRVVSFKGM
jgi:diguanylate cyclase (GGDEF)-like protein